MIVVLSLPRAMHTFDPEEPPKHLNQTSEVELPVDDPIVEHELELRFASRYISARDRGQTRNANATRKR